MIIEYKTSDNFRLAFDSSEIAVISEESNWDYPNTTNIRVTLKSGREIVLYKLSMYDELLSAMQTNFKLGK